MLPASEDARRFQHQLGIAKRPVAHTVVGLAGQHAVLQTARGGADGCFGLLPVRALAGKLKRAHTRKPDSWSAMTPSQGITGFRRRLFRRPHITAKVRPILKLRVEPMTLILKG